jgi:hypothetical protein
MTARTRSAFRFCRLTTRHLAPAPALGYYVADVRDVAGLADYIDLAELEEVEHDSGTDLAGQSDPDTRRRRVGGRPA